MADETTTPKLTQRMTSHINGGGDFSELHYAILADGQPTGVTLHTRTDGRPDYYITDKHLAFGDERFDMMNDDGDPVEWILARIDREATR